MSYSSLLVHVDVDGEIGGRVRLAAGLADHFHSHLIGAASWMARAGIRSGGRDHRSGADRGRL